MTVRSRIAAHPLLAFFVITFSYTWSLHGVRFAFSSVLSESVSFAIIPLSTFGPAVGAAIVVWASAQSLRQWIGQVFRGRVPVRWYMVAFAIPPFLLLVSVGIYAALGLPISISPGITVIGPAIGFFFIALVLFGGQEELGWRGYALLMLQSRDGALWASVIIGIFWAVWHFPLFFDPFSPHSSFPLSRQILFVPFTIVLAIMLTWLYNSTGGSVLLAMILHAAFNASVIPLAAIQGPMVTVGVSPWLIDGVFMGAGMILAVILVVIYGPSSISRKNGPGPSRFERDISKEHWM